MLCANLLAFRYDSDVNLVAPDVDVLIVYEKIGMFLHTGLQT